MNQLLLGNIIKENKIFLVSLVLVVLLALITLFAFSTATDVKSQADELIIEAYWPGASSAEIENNITKPLTRELMSLEGYDYLYTISEKENSTIKLKFNSKSVAEAKWQQVQDTVNNLKTSLPSSLKLDFQIPLIKDPDFALIIFNENNKIDQLISDTEYLKQELEKLSGISSLKINGEQSLEVFIEVDHQKLNAYYNLTLKDIKIALEGFMQTNLQGKINRNQGDLNFSINSAFQGLDDIANLTINVSQETMGKIRLKDIALVYFKPKEDSAIIRHNGRHALVLSGNFTGNKKNVNSISKEIDRIINIEKDKISRGTEIDRFNLNESNIFAFLETKKNMSFTSRSKLVESISANLRENTKFFGTVISDGEGLIKVFLDEGTINRQDLKSTFTKNFPTITFEPKIRIGLIGDSGEFEDGLAELKRMLDSHSGVLHIQENDDFGSYEYNLDIDYQKGSYLGVNPGDIQEAIDLATAGSMITSLILDGQEYKVNLKSDLSKIEELLDLSIKSALGGQRVFLKEIANLNLVAGEAEIKKYNGRDIAFLTLETVTGLDKKALEKEIRSYLDQKGRNDLQIKILETFSR